MELEDLTVEQLKVGYVENEVILKCVFCEKQFDQQEIFKIGERFYSAKRAIEHHIQEVHGSVLESLLSLDKKYTGLSDVQVDLLKLFAQGLNDKEIVSHTSANSVSTIRQHRFKLKEKERQAKVFIAIMNTLQTMKLYEPIHKGAKQVDERYAITAEEREKVIGTYFKSGIDGEIQSFPSKEKRKIILLQQIIKRFENERKYKEKEVNDILKTVYTDYVSLRRYLIEYGFMERSNDCATYWVKEAM